MIRVTAARMRKNRVLSTYIVFRKRPSVKRIMNLESTEPVPLGLDILWCYHFAYLTD